MQRISADRLAFHVKPGQATALGGKNLRKCDDGHKTKETIYYALDMTFRPVFKIAVISLCKAHIPRGHWVEGEDAYTQEPDPLGDRTTEAIMRRLRKEGKI